MNNRLIALCSPAMGSGKSVVAATLVEQHGFMLVKFAGTLKRMIGRLLRDLGYPDDLVAEMVDGRRKEAPIAYLDILFRGHTISDLLDNMLRELFNDIALPDSYIERLLSDLGNEPTDLGATTNYLRCSLNKWLVDCVLFQPTITPRWLQQSLGTEWGRDLVRPDLWIHIAKLKVRAYQFIGGGRDIVIDDMRFINEYSAVVELGGTAVRVLRPGVYRTTPPHPSEGALDDLPMHIIINDEGIAELRERARLLLL